MSSFARLTSAQRTDPWPRIRDARAHAPAGERRHHGRHGNLSSRRWARELPTVAFPDAPGADETAAIDDTGAIGRALDRLTPDQHRRRGHSDVPSRAGGRPGNLSRQ